MIAIVDYGRGNLHSVTSALNSVGEDVTIASTPDDLESASRIVLPGVGAFPAGMNRLHKSGLVESLEEQVRGKGKPFLGICLGMQFLATASLEGTKTQGLGWIDATVQELPALKHGLKLPHIGWNETLTDDGSALFAGMGFNPTLYYVHSYAVTMNSDEGAVAAWCDYGNPFIAALLFDNIAATQFHPEKSQSLGLKFLTNWAKWTP